MSHTTIENAIATIYADSLFEQWKVFTPKVATRKGYEQARRTCLKWFKNPDQFCIAYELIGATRPLQYESKSEFNIKTAPKSFDIQPLLRIEHRAHSGEGAIYDIAVDPKYQGRGIAKQLYKAGIDYLRENGCKYYRGGSSTQAVLGLNELLNRRIINTNYYLSF